MQKYSEVKQYKLVTLIILYFLFSTAFAACPASIKAQDLMPPLMRNLVFQRVWKTVADNYVYEDFRGIDWQSSKENYAKDILHARSNKAFYLSLDQMIYDLNDDHSVYLAPWESCIEDEQILEDESQQSDQPQEKLEEVTLERLEANPTVVLATVTSFDSQFVDEAFTLELRNLLLEGSVDTLIIDLRNNYGGYIDTAFNMLGHFVQGKLGLEIDRQGQYPIIISSGRYFNRLKDTQVIVFVNEESHSASELFAGILQLERGALIVGSRSAGNTELLLPFDFLDGSRLWLAVSSFRLRNGINLEGQGVIPDILVEADSDYLEAALRHLDNRLVSQ